MSDRRQRLGQAGERLAAVELQKRGLSIWATNRRTPYGEIDIVARDGETWVFVEVRTRRGEAFGTPEESLTPVKRQHLIAAAQHFLQEQRTEASPWRIDLVAVALDKTGKVLRVDQMQHAVESPDA